MNLAEDIAAEVRKAEAVYDEIGARWAEAMARYHSTEGDYPADLQQTMEAALQRYHRLLRVAQQNGVVVYQPGEKVL